MRKLVGTLMASVVVAAMLGACGGGSRHAVRIVRVDYSDDDFPSSFLSYFPRNVEVHPGDTVRFVQTWTGEPHSVTMGRVVDKFFTYVPTMMKYGSEEDARAHGLPDATIKAINAASAKIPGMTDNDGQIYEGGARPCFVGRLRDVPTYAVNDGEVVHGAQTNCPTAGRAQPAFTGRQALYNSGYIPWQGNQANSFEVKIAANATPGTYRYFCNYHWVDMSGTVKIVAPDTPIPTRAAVNQQTLAEVRADLREPLAAVQAARRSVARPGHVSAGADTGRYGKGFVSANVFVPSKITVKAGSPVTWGFLGLEHTVSFNVPKYFPVFTVDKKGDVRYDKRAHDAVRWTVPPAQHSPNGEPLHRDVDVGKWDGVGGFHSSGLLSEGDTFSVTFTKPGTYPYACAVHPLMIGRVVVTA